MKRYIYINRERERERERDQKRTYQKRQEEIVPLGKIEIGNYRLK